MHFYSFRGVRQVGGLECRVSGGKASDWFVELQGVRVKVRFRLLECKHSFT